MSDLRKAAQQALETFEEINAENNYDEEIASLRAALEAPVPAPEFKPMRIEPTTAMIDAGVAFALNSHLSGDYTWSEYVRDLFVHMAAFAPEAQP